ncbi:MAG: FkbM family methyltransferase [Bacteroidales bacterium]|nr:FkbM family methyltransferase [Bacteroidales bacterium]
MNYSFIGKFKCKVNKNSSFFLYNNNFDLESNIFWVGLNNLEWEQKERMVWMKLSRFADNILDIGSNTGVYSLISKVSNKKSNVIAFEPQPNIFNILTKNIQINKMNIKCINKALSNFNGTAQFYNYGDKTFEDNSTTAGSLNKEWRPENQHSIEVDVITLSNFIEENNIKNIDLIKMDVETNEYEVLVGYGKYLYVHQPIILLEIQNENIGKKIETLFDYNSYTFFHFLKSEEMQKINHLGISSNGHNYLICPNSKLTSLDL